MLKKVLTTPIRERWVFEIKNSPDLEVHGIVGDHKYTIGDRRVKVAEISKQWFRSHDCDGVAIDPGQEDMMILAVTVGIDEIAHPRDRRE